MTPNNCPSAGGGTKSDGIDTACEFSIQMLHNLERAANHPDMTEEVAELLSTQRVTVEHRVETGVTIDWLPLNRQMRF